MDKLNRELRNKIVDLLTPYMDTVGSRQALVQSALFGSPVLNHINWSGPSHQFTVHLITVIDNFGPTELIAILEELKQNVGQQKQQTIEQIIDALTTPNVEMNKKGQQKMSVEAGILVGFLIEVGRWAKSELSERWKLRRNQEEADLTQQDEVEIKVPQQLDIIVAERSSKEVERTIKLIERKRDAIFRARKAKLADREDYDAQKLTKSAFEQRTEEHDDIIQQMLGEIADDLESLGWQVDRESL